MGNDGERTGDVVQLVVEHRSPGEGAEKQASAEGRIAVQGLNRDQLPTAYFYLGEISRAEGGEDWRRHYRMGIEVLEARSKKCVNEIWQLAMKYYQLGENRKSRVYLERLIQTPGVNGDQLSSAYFHLGEISRAEGGEDCRHHYRRGVEVLESKEEKGAHDIWQLATKYYQLGENRKSRAYLERLIQIPGVNGDQLSSAYFHLGEISRAEGGEDWKQYYRRGVEVLESKEEKGVNDIWQLATKYYQLGENRKSRAYLERLIQTPGVNRDQLSSAYLHLSKISREEGGNEWKEYARQRIKLLEAKKDKTIDTIQQLATEHFQLGNYRESEMNLKSITQSKEATRDQSFHAHFCLAEIAQTTGRRNWRTHYLRAIQLLQTKRQKSHEDIYRIASLYKRLGDYRSSNRWFRRLLSVTTQQPLISGSYFHLGETCYFQSRLQEAKTYFEKCLRLNPGHRRAREYMSELA